MSFISRKSYTFASGNRFERETHVETTFDETYRNKTTKIKEITR